MGPGSEIENILRKGSILQIIQCRELPHSE